MTQNPNMAFGYKGLPTLEERGLEAYWVDIPGTDTRVLQLRPKTLSPALPWIPEFQPATAVYQGNVWSEWSALDERLKRLGVQLSGDVDS